MKRALLILIVIILTAFGLLTLFMSSSVLFDLFGIRAREGNYVLIVVWANFICSFLCLFAAYGLLNKKKWTTTLLGVSALVLIAAFAGLLIHINSGGLYETKTIAALLFRIAVTLAFATYAYTTISKKRI